MGLQQKKKTISGQKLAIINEARVGQGSKERPKLLEIGELAV